MSDSSCSVGFWRDRNILCFMVTFLGAYLNWICRQNTTLLHTLARSNTWNKFSSRRVAFQSKNVLDNTFCLNIVDNIKHIVCIATPFSWYSVIYGTILHEENYGTRTKKDLYVLLFVWMLTEYTDIVVVMTWPVRNF